jgi:ribose transport system ATP-binding protein
MTGICKGFPGVDALNDAELEVVPGEVHVLLGENGAGKSTLMKVLCGQYALDRGTILLEGAGVRPASPLEAERLGLVMIHQELNLVPGLTVAENIYLGHEATSAGLIQGRLMRAGARRLLERLKSTIDPDSRVDALSVAGQQLVEIARALREEARLMVMDEPTAALADTEIAALFEVIRSLCAQGVAVIYISHRMREIFAIGDRVTVMRDGRTVGVRRVATADPDELIRLMVGRSIAEQIPKRRVPIGEPALEVEGLTVAGLMGSGRTELARAIFGADAADAGAIRVAGRPLSRRTPAGSIAAGVGFLTEDRKRQGLVLQCTVAENITLTTLDDFLRFGALDLARERIRARSLVDRLRIRAASLEQRTVDLSGGNQQKVVLARWLAARCRVLLFDEPTRGIDVAAKAEIYELIGELVEQGVAVVLISSEMPELVGLADRVAVMHEGGLRGILEGCQMTPERILHLALGGDQAADDGAPAA